MDKIVDKLAGLGVAGLVLLIVISTGGLAGAAAFTAALALLGGPFGMIGGMITLGLIFAVSAAIANFGVDALAHAVVRRLLKKGMTKAEVIKKINKFPIISRSLKAILRDYVNSA